MASISSYSQTMVGGFPLIQAALVAVAWSLVELVVRLERRWLPTRSELASDEITEASI